MKTAAVYIRVSTDDQLEYSPAAQLREIQKFAVANDMIINDKYIFRDEGISGRHAKNRPEFNHMIGLAKTKPKPFDVILLWKFSRFARNREDAIVYKSMLRKQLGIDVISVSENVGDDKMSVLIEAFIEAMDEYYSINLAEEVKRGMTEKALKGGIQTIASFGYDRSKDSPMTINESEARWVRYMFNQFIAGKGIWTIAQELNANGVCTKRGNPFENRSVEYILNNPVYIGKIRWTPTGKTLSKRIYDSKDTIIRDGKHDPIITNDIFMKTQQILSERKKNKGKYEKPAGIKKHWLSGIVKCDSCGASLTLQRANGYFQCSRYNHGKCKVSHSISERKLTTAIISALESVTVTEDFIMQNKAVLETSDTTNLKKQIARLERLFDRAKEAYLEGIDTIEEYRANKTKISAEIKSLQIKLKEEAPKNELPKPEEIQEKIDSVIKVLKSEETDNETKSNTIKSVLEKAVFFKGSDSLDLFFKF